MTLFFHQIAMLIYSVKLIEFKYKFNRMDQFTKEELLSVIDSIAKQYQIGECELDKYVAEIKLKKFKQSEYYQPSIELTDKINNSIVPDLDINLLYLDDGIDLSSFITSPKFIELLKFVETNSLYKNYLNYYEYFELAVIKKECDLFKFIYRNYDIKEEVIENFNSWADETLLIIEHLEELKFDLIQTYKRDECNKFMCNYYLLRPEEFTNEIMHTILQIEYKYHRRIIKSEMRDLFAKLINPDEYSCIVCYSNECDCKSIIPIKYNPFHGVKIKSRN